MTQTRDAMTVFAAHGDLDEDHIRAVMAEMRGRGAPTIRAIEVCGCVVAIEGCHRLEAAYRLGIVPTIEVVSDPVITGLDLDDRDTWDAGDLADYIYPPNGAAYEI